MVSRETITLGRTSLMPVIAGSGLWVPKCGMAPRGYSNDNNAASGPDERAGGVRHLPADHAFPGLKPSLL